MRKIMRWFSTTLATLLVGGFLLTATPAASAWQVRRRVIVVEPFYPYYPWGWAIRMGIRRPTSRPTTAR